MIGSYYKKKNMEKLSELNSMAAKAYEAFCSFDNAVMSSGQIPVKLKELIAVACAHITGCPYCIDKHVNAAKKQKATPQEIGESIFVATALKAGAALAHGINTLNALDDSNGDEELYSAERMSRLGELSALAEEPFKAFFNFDAQAMKSGALTAREKELIAVACTHVTGCSYCIHTHVRNAKKLGVSIEEIGECIFIATALKAGSAFTRGVNAIIAYDEE